MPESKSPNYLGPMGTDASKSRRERNREAQQQFRKRRQAAEAARVQRLKRLEGVVERMSTVIVDFADKMLQEEVLKQYPALAADVQDVITQVLVLANEAGDPEGTRSNERHEEKSPDYGDDDSDTRRCSQDSASPSGSQNLPIGMPFSFDQQDMFITSSPPEHSQLKDTPQIEQLLRTAFLLADGLLHAGLRAGDRVANLFYAGDLYGSFLLRILSVIYLPIPAIQIPIGGLIAPDMTAHLLRTCHATAVLSIITSLVWLASYCRPKQEMFLSVTAIMFGGEPMFDDQVAAVAYLFPNATIRSCVYGSIDARVVAVSAGSSDPAEHIVLSAAAIVEILVDQDGHLVPTEQPDIPGTLVTNLIRDLTPVIRYPTGDRAEWIDKPAGIFRLLGCSNYAVRLAPVSLDISHLSQLARAVLKTVAIEAFQVPSPPPAASGDAIIEMLSEQRPMLKKHIEMGLVAPAKVCFKSICDMKANPRSGKLPEVIDLRLSTV
ncbi:ANL, N-terminal domain [Fusarium oxysporum f. sp. vasinfectum]|nr:ANL, N-terminal domain [Fusarium oxysporum f. sp. vasinfectum]KAK2925891.1 ANL, N-terminal domain [Fusarium oxysporum f. sp. vasinfectum]